MLAIKHLNYTIQYHKDFFTVICVPFIRAIGPMQSCGYAIHIGDIQGAPGLIGYEFFASDDLHSFFPCGG